MVEPGEELLGGGGDPGQDGAPDASEEMSGGND